MSGSSGKSRCLMTISGQPTVSLRWHAIRRSAKLVGWALAVVSLSLLLTACTLVAGESAPPPTPPLSASAAATPAPELEPSPTSSVAPSPTVTATAGAERSERRVENLVWLGVRSCADRLSNLMGVGVSVKFETKYDAQEGVWIVEAFSREPSISLGIWRVTDFAGEVAPHDEVAGSIADPLLNCQPPVAVLAADNTPPHFIQPTPTPTPGPTSVLNPPTPTAEPSIPGGTSPPGGAAPTPTPGPTPFPTPTPIPLTEDQAALRVWMATYECHSPPLESSTFTSRSIGPQHSLVEGRSEGENVRLYGLWLVNISTGTITAWDRTARSDISLSCFKRP